jgi:CHAD domain-containing protein
MAASVSRSEVLIRQRLQALRRVLPAAEHGDPAAIHQARVATRRLREALPLVAAGNRRRKLERNVRDLTRALGPVRELDVALLMLDELAAAATAPKSGVKSLRTAVAQERGRLHADLVQTLQEWNLTKVTRKAVRSARRQDETPRRTSAGRDPRHVASAYRRAGRRAAALRTAIETAAGLYLPDRLHEVRIAVKKLRYGLEIVREVTRSRATARILTLKRAQDLLGRMHDLEVLIARTRAVQGAANAPTLRVSADLDRLVRTLETESQQLHGQYVASRASLLDICDHVEQMASRRGRASRAA